MKIIRFELNRVTQYGVVEGEDVFSMEGDILGDFSAGKKLCRLNEVRLLAPVKPNMVVGIGGNYYGLLKVDSSVHTKPEAFLKAPSAVIGHLDNIIYPKIVDNIHLEGELAVIIKREARHVSKDQAMEYVLGYTCTNDVTAHIEGDKGSARIKSFYSFCPLGPCIVTGLDPGNLNITSRVNGNVEQDADSTSDMVWNVPAIIEHVTEFMALQPLDVILTGSTRPPKLLNVGDVVEVEIGGIGLLRNSVVSQ